MRDPAWSPDGKRLAVVILDRIWMTAPDGRDARELTRVAESEREPAWSFDGKRIVFVADRGDGFDLYVIEMTDTAARCRAADEATNRCGRA